MKKVFLALILLLTAFVFFGTRSYAAGTGNLVVHFKAWDGNYDDLGSWAWGDTAVGKLKSGVDDFGAYFEFNDVAVGTSVGFIAVNWIGTGGPNWDEKLTGDVNIDASAIVEDQTTHVYVFQGAATSAGNPAHYIAKNDAPNMLVVYYDPSGAYEETLGVHSWGWEGTGPEWGTPAQILTNAGFAPSGIEVKAAMLQAAEDWAGLLIYAGSDATKKTGDVTLAGTEAALDGEVGIAYVVSKGDAYTAGDNVFYNDYASFKEEAFTFKLMPFNNTDKSGTYAVDPNTIIVKTSAQVTSPYPTAVDKDAARATIKSWFTVREVTGEDTYGDPLAIERVDFATSNATLNAFVLILDDALDNTKEYEVFFSLFPTLQVAKEVEVTINVTVPANTPVDAVIKLAGNVNGWNPEHADFGAVQVGTSLVYSLTFTVEVTNPFTSFEYKWTRGSWATEEFVATNRPLVIPNTVDSIVFEDVVEAWADIDAPENKYAAPVREAEINIEASLPVAMDTEKPVLTFISPSGIVGKIPAERIINVTWGQPFNQNLFPRFRVVDDRDGDITPFVYVPKGANSVLDTRTVGDYTIMLRVVDKWGNVTEETFIFRVAKSS